jgi:hypothetical protein
MLSVFAAAGKLAPVRMLEHGSACRCTHMHPEIGPSGLVIEPLLAGTRYVAAAGLVWAIAAE